MTDDQHNNASPSPAGHADDGHPAHLAHHFDTVSQQFEAGKQGMWLFLATEVLLFGGLFCAYGVYRGIHPEIFVYASQYLNRTLGAINTLVLICSSFTMAYAVNCAQRGRQKLLVINLVITLVCAFGFLGIKYVEYEHKWKDGLLPGQYYAPKQADHGLAGETSAPATVSQPHDVSGKDVSATADDEPRKVRLFFSIYFAMTGLHGLHVVAGMVVITWLLVRSVKGHFGPAYFAPVDFGGLYWHLVDLIWIFLFPLLYLI